jgi:uncharacterized membrane protein
MHNQQVNRLETLSDGVFALAATLLVVTLEVPDSLPSMLQALQGLPAFAASFTLLLLVWSAHHKFFEAYNLQDGGTQFLNGLLLFVVLAYVYPLKFLTNSFFQWTLGLGPQVIHSWEQLQSLFLVYSAGWTGVFLCFAALYHHAWRRRDLLGLDAHQSLDARLHREQHLTSAAVGVLSMLIAWSGFGLAFGLPGAIYGLLGVSGWWHANRAERAHAALGQA